MTPRTIEEGLFKIIQTQKEALLEIQDLSCDAPLFDLEHPQVLRAKLALGEGQTPPKFEHREWSASFYKNFSEALLFYTRLEHVKGAPHEVFKFLTGTAAARICVFSPLGATVLSRSELTHSSSRGDHLFLLPPWVSYAVSPELWSGIGKWPRFHERLHTLFEKFQLLQGEDHPGFYPLKAKAKQLEKHGFRGSVVNNSYILVPNWTFPLSALIKLEEAVEKEF